MGEELWKTVTVGSINLGGVVAVEAVKKCIHMPKNNNQDQLDQNQQAIKLGPYSPSIVTTDFWLVQITKCGIIYSSAFKTALFFEL